MNYFYQIEAFINLEAAGAGGKEVVFQTGPSNPWLAMAWAANAPHPFGTIVAQELFQSGVIPAESDFRYGNSQLPAGWWSGNAFVSGARDLRFNSWACRIKGIVANSSPPLQRFFERSCVAQAQ